ncbi:MAG: hypothetical protein J7K30_09430 [Deltaproteobacteria bacterium]|nr:hypothetical protein [Deltaproteobacteria bacterium]
MKVYCFNYLCCKRRQPVVCFPALYYLQAFNYVLANPAASQKEDRRTPQGFTTNHYLTANSGAFFETLSSA